MNKKAKKMDIWKPDIKRVTALAPLFLSHRPSQHGSVLQARLLMAVAKWLYSVWFVMWTH